MSQIVLFTGYDKSTLCRFLVERGLRVGSLVVPADSKFDQSSRGSIDYAESIGIPISRARVADGFATAPPPDATQILVSARFPLKIPSGYHSGFRHALNIHPTLLPRYRGRYLEPILSNGELESGVTIHLISDRIDAGPIVAQERYMVEPFDTVIDLMKKAEEIEGPLLIEALDRVGRPDFVPAAQDETLATEYFNRRSPVDSQIDSSSTIKSAHDLFRACDPTRFPLFTIIGGEEVEISFRRRRRKGVTSTHEI